MSIQATFAAMGLRAKKSLVHHLLVENAYDKNLLSDISNVDYLQEDQGRTTLQPLPRLLVFVNDINIFGYLRPEDVVKERGTLSCTLGECGSAKTIVAKVLPVVRETTKNKPDKETKRC